MRNIIYVWRGICVILSWLFPYLATCEALCTIVANGTDVTLPMLLPSCPRSNTWMVPFSVLAYRIFLDLSIHSWTRGSENRITKLGASFYCNFSCFYSHFTVLVLCQCPSVEKGWVLSNIYPTIHHICLFKAKLHCLFSIWSSFSCFVTYFVWLKTHLSMYQKNCLSCQYEYQYICTPLNSIKGSISKHLHYTV